MIKFWHADKDLAGLVFLALFIVILAAMILLGIINSRRHGIARNENLRKYFGGGTSFSGAFEFSYQEREIHCSMGEGGKDIALWWREDIKNPFFIGHARLYNYLKTREGQNRTYWAALSSGTNTATINGQELMLRSSDASLAALLPNLLKVDARQPRIFEHPAALWAESKITTLSWKMFSRPRTIYFFPLPKTIYENPKILEGYLVDIFALVNAIKMHDGA